MNDDRLMGDAEPVSKSYRCPSCGWARRAESARLCQKCGDLMVAADRAGTDVSRMRQVTGTLLGAVVAAGTLVPAAPAQAAVIVCHVARLTYLSADRVVLRISSNHPDPHRVHAFRVHTDTDVGAQVRTYTPTGPNLVVNYGGDRITWVDGWQAGTRCTGVRG